MEDPTRQYLARVIDWSDVTAGHAWVNIHHTKQAEQDNKTSKWAGFASQDLHTSVKQVGYCNSHNLNVFLRQSTCAEVNPKNPQYIFRNAASRGKPAHKLRTFFFDLDVKEGAYASAEEAMADLDRVCIEVSLPPPQVLVRSGNGGLHVYWVMNVGITLDVWLPLARAFIVLLANHGLKFDRQCSSDSKRLLRVPGSMNYKSGTPKPVTLVEERWIDQDYTLEQLKPPSLSEAITPQSNGGALATALAVATQGIQAIPNHLGELTQRPATAVQDTGEFSQGVGARAPVDLTPVVEWCGIFREAMETGGNGHEEGLWQQLIYNTTFGVDGRTYAHAMSKGDPRYTPAGTDAKYDQKVLARAADPKMGWTTCATFEALRPEICAVCPQRGKIGHPLRLAVQFGAARPASTLTGIQPAAPWGAGTPGAPGPLQLPFPFEYRGVEIWKKGNPDKKTGQPSRDTLVLHYAIISAKLEDSRDKGCVLLLELRMPHGRVACITVPGGKTTPADLRGAFGPKGIPLNKYQGEAMEELIVDFMTQLQHATVYLNPNTPPLGWVKDDKGNYLGFAYDGIVHGATGLPAGAGDANFMVHYRPKGAYQAWQDAANFVLGQWRYDLAAIIAAAFASPLVAFSGQPGLFVSAYSLATGIGKSGAMRIGQAVWAHPTSAMATISDTPKSVANRMGLIKNCPAYWDEIGGPKDAARLMPLVFQLGQGRDKTRLTEKIEQRDITTWLLMMIVASNHSMRDLVAKADRNNDPGTVRCFEFKVKKVATPNHDPVAADRLLDGVNDNYGHAGLVYAKWLGSNHAKAQQAFDAVKDGILKRVGYVPEERFWIASMTCLITGAYIAKQLNICQFDVRGLEDFLIQVLKDLREARASDVLNLEAEGGVMAVLGNYYRDKQARNLLVTDIIHTGRGKPYIKVISDVASSGVTDGVHIQIGLVDRKMRIDKESFTEWLRARDLPPSAVLDGLKKFLSACIWQGTMAAGVERSGAMRVMVIDLDIAPVVAADHIDLTYWDNKLARAQAAGASTSTNSAMAQATHGIVPGVPPTKPKDH